MGSVADERPDIGAIHYCFRFLFFCQIFKSQCSQGKWAEKTGQKSVLFVKIGEGLWSVIYAMPQF